MDPFSVRLVGRSSSTPFCLCTMNSGSAPWSVAITGVELASASMAVKPKVSPNVASRQKCDRRSRSMTARLSREAWCRTLGWSSRAKYLSKKLVEAGSVQIDPPTCRDDTISTSRGKLAALALRGQLDRHATALPGEVAADEGDLHALRDVFLEQILVFRGRPHSGNARRACRACRVRRAARRACPGRFCERARKLRRWRDSARPTACRSSGESRLVFSRPNALGKCNSKPMMNGVVLSGMRLKA